MDNISGIIALSYDDDLNAITFESSYEIEKVIRVIAIDPTDKYKKGNLRLGVITIDLSNVIALNGKQVYKEYFDKVKLHNFITCYDFLLQAVMIFILLNTKMFAILC